MAGNSTVGEAGRAALIGWLFENSLDLMYLVGPTGLFELVNPAWERQTGWTEAELIGHPVIDWFHPDDLPGVAERMKLAGTGAVTESEIRVRMKNGRWRWHAVRRQITEGVHIVTMRDVTEERLRSAELVEARDAARRGEQQMRKARGEAQATAERLKIALQAAEAGVYEIDHVHKTFWASPEFARLTGQYEATYDEVTKLTSRLPSRRPRAGARASFVALHRGAETSGELRSAHRPAGRRDPLDPCLAPPEGGRNGRWRKAVGLVQDFDARKRQALALLEAQRRPRRPARPSPRSSPT